MTADYRDLLKRYMRHVEAVESTTFIGSLRQTSVGLAFSEEDIAELQAVETEAMAEQEQAIAAWRADKASEAQS